MSVTGLCEVCGQPGVDHTCERCGQLVCDDHFEDALSVCTECVSEVGSPQRRNDPDTDTGPGPDGTDTYRF